MKSKIYIIASFILGLSLIQGVLIFTPNHFAHAAVTRQCSPPPMPGCPCSLCRDVQDNGVPVSNSGAETQSYMICLNANANKCGLTAPIPGYADPFATPGDVDGDGVPDSRDNCNGWRNADQTDYDGDGIGNTCDPTPGKPSTSATSGGTSAGDSGTSGGTSAGSGTSGGTSAGDSGTSGGTASGGYTPAPYTDKNQGEIIPCDTNCTWAHLYVLVRQAIDFMLFKLALPLAVVSVAIAGWLFLVSGFNESSRTQAKGILWGVLIGLFFVIAAWLIVHLVVEVLVNPAVSKDFPTEQKP